MTEAMTSHSITPIIPRHVWLRGQRWRESGWSRHTCRETKPPTCGSRTSSPIKAPWTHSLPLDYNRRLKTNKMKAELNLPAGFRFHPTDEELVKFYLCRRCASEPISVPVIAEIDLYKFNPWELPGYYYYAISTSSIFKFLLILIFKLQNSIFFLILFFRQGVVRRERMVLLLTPRPEIPKRFASKPGSWNRLLESDWSW